MEVITVTKTISDRAFIISPNEAHLEVTQSVSIQRGHTNLPTVSVGKEDLEEFKLPSMDSNHDSEIQSLLSCR